MVVNGEPWKVVEQGRAIFSMSSWSDLVFWSLSPLTLFLVFLQAPSATSGRQRV